MNIRPAVRHLTRSQQIAIVGGKAPEGAKREEKVRSRLESLGY